MKCNVEINSVCGGIQFRKYIPLFALSNCSFVKRPNPTILCSRPNKGFSNTENVNAFGR
jgi:hypothetical protein